ncbi:hypothetical protein HDV06_000191 [Boothiomyces sp. JEL0866]|nr:hypothetical protein HDV06_000191 [Boothiomyces sp. JEL0866]
MTELKQVEFEAIELQADGTFLQAHYKYKNVEGGVCIYRNETLHLELKGEYFIMETIACGICCTDCARPFLPYPLPQVIGHEVVVSVPSTISVSGSTIGVVEINNSHKSHGSAEPCSYCASGLSSQCPSRITMGINTWPGGLAKYVIVPKYNLYQIPLELDISPTTATLIEPFAAALHGVGTVWKGGRDYAILGAGKLGLMTIAALSLSRNLFERDITITAILRSEKNQEEALLFGATRAIVTNGKPIRDEFDVVFDTTGSAQGLEYALSISRTEVHLKSTHGQPMLGFKHFTEMVVSEISLVPFSENSLLFNCKDTPNANIYVSPSVSKDITKKITDTNRNIYQNSSGNADHWLENGGGNVLLSEGSKLPRFDLAVCTSAEEVDEIVTPNPSHDRSLVRVRGAILIANPKENALLEAICNRKVKITTSRCGDFSSAIKTLLKPTSANIAKNLNRLVTHQYPLELLPLALDVVSGKQKTDKKVLKLTVVNSPPLSANNINYCVIESESHTGFLTSTNTCVNGWSCSMESLTIYDNKNCFGQAIKTLPLTSTPTNVTSNSLGNVVLQSMKITSGTVKYQWTAVIPQSEIVLGFTTIPEILAFLLFATATILQAYLFGYSAREAYRYRERKEILISFVNFNYLLSIILNFCYGFSKIPSSAISLVFRGIIFFTINQTELCSLIVNLQMVSKIFYFTKFQTTLMYLAMTLVHFTFAGYRYFYVLAYNFPLVVSAIVFKMGYLYFVWIVFYNICQCVSPALITWKMKNSPKYKGKWMLKAYGLAICQLIVSIIYMFGFYIRGSSELLASDKNALAFTAVTSSLILLQNAILMKFNYMLELVIIKVALGVSLSQVAKKSNGKEITNDSMHPTISSGKDINSPENFSKSEFLSKKKKQDGFPNAKSAPL